MVGRPNVGKSTLLNRFLGQKIAIVSPKPETTRDRLLGILTQTDAQILFLDTPGIYRGPKTLLGKHQVREAQEALQGADVLLLMTEAHAGLTDEDKQILRLLPKAPSGRHSRESGNLDPHLREDDRTNMPVFLAINKVDRVRKDLILPQIQEANRLYPFREIFPISATKGDNTAELLWAITAALPEGPALYPADQLTDKPVRTLVQEIVREKALLFTHEEIPHAVAVLIEEWRPGKSARAAANPLYIRATVYVERDSQKGILIGKGGSLLKKIGEAARKEIEPLAESPVFLELWVKVAKNWRRDPAMLRRLGYG